MCPVTETRIPEYTSFYIHTLLVDVSLRVIRELHNLKKSTQHIIDFIDCISHCGFILGSSGRRIHYLCLLCNTRKLPPIMAGKTKAELKNIFLAKSLATVTLIYSLLCNTKSKLSDVNRPVNGSER